MVKVISKSKCGMKAMLVTPDGTKHCRFVKDGVWRHRYLGDDGKHHYKLYKVPS